jgi:hypothetical protein
MHPLLLCVLCVRGDCSGFRVLLLATTAAVVCKWGVGCRRCKQLQAARCKQLQAARCKQLQQSLSAPSATAELRSHGLSSSSRGSAPSTAMRCVQPVFGVQHLLTGPQSMFCILQVVVMCGACAPLLWWHMHAGSLHLLQQEPVPVSL